MGNSSSAELSLLFVIVILFMVVVARNSNNTKKRRILSIPGPQVMALSKIIKNNTGQHLMFSLNGNEQGYIGTFGIAVNAKQCGQ
jgi:hypothetical protein